MAFWSPIFGLPCISFLVWWILDRRIPALVLVIPLALLSFRERMVVGAPLRMTDEEVRETPGEEFVQICNRNRPGYKRKIFPPYRVRPAEK